MNENQEAKLDHVVAEISEIKVIIAKQEENIAHHIYRTDLAEKNIEALRIDLKPVETHVKHIEGALKVVGFLALIVTIGTGIIKIIQFFR